MKAGVKDISLGGAVRLLFIVFLAAALANLWAPGTERAAAGRRTQDSEKTAHLKRLTDGNYPPGSYLPGEVVVKLEEPAVISLAGVLEEFGDILDGGWRELATALSGRSGLSVNKLRLRAGVGELEGARRLTSSPQVELAEPNILFQASFTPNDPGYGDQWNLSGPNGVDASSAWDLQRGSASNVVAVIDTGIDYLHADLAGRIVAGYDYYHGDPDARDDNGHGTQVSGVICANTDNSIGIAGLDWSARIMPLKALGADGVGSLDAVINCVNHAAVNGADVINMSFTSREYSELLAEAVEYAHDSGCLLTASVGNDYGSDIKYPAGMTYVIGAGATNRAGVRAPFSNFNYTVDLVAPGVDILGPSPGDTYQFGTGTSDACPHIAGAALLLLADDPGAAPQDIWRRMRDSARDLGGPGYDEEYGWGLLDINGSLRTPEVTVTAPQDYSYPESGKISAEAENAHLDIEYMELFVDGDLESSHTFATPAREVSHTFDSWDLSQLEEGTHTITVRAVDAGENWQGEDTVTVYRNQSQPQPSRDWYLAEGTTAWGFEEYVLVQNPNSEAADLKVTFMKPGGATQEFSYSMPGYSRLTLAVNELVPGSDLSTHVKSDLPVVTERAMYWGSRDGGHAALGVKEGCSSWLLAEGTTAWGFEEYVLVQNPNSSSAQVVMDFLKPDGDRKRVVYDVGALSRFTLNVAEVVPGSDVSTFVRSDLPVISERAMYWAKDGRSRAGGHCSTGSVTSARNWYLAEGTTAWGFDEYVLLANPTDDIAHATLVFMRTDGSTWSCPVDIGAMARTTVYANEVDPGRDASVQVISDMPLAVERAMYWDSKEGGTDALGVLQP